MLPTDHPLPSPEAVLRQGFDDYALLFHPLFGEVIALSPVSLDIWRALDGKRSLAEIAARVQAQFDDAPADTAADVAAFLDDLKRRGFVSTDPKGFITGQAQDFSNKPALSATRTVQAKPIGSAVLSLADGSRFRLVAEDETAGRVLSQFASSAGLTPAADRAAARPAGEDDDLQTLRVATDGESAAPRAPGERVLTLQPLGVQPPITVEAGRGIRRPRSGQPTSESEWLWLQLVRLSAFIGQHIQPRGGLLVHSALAIAPILHPLSPDLKEKGIGDRGLRDEGVGVLLAGRSGVGKSTASRRLPSPWRALSDDVTLIVRDPKGQYWAHPWPTWSRIFEQHKDDRWNVQAAVPLQAVCILEQGQEDHLRPASPSEAVVLLMELSRQAAQRLWLPGRTDLNSLSEFQRKRFDNVCALVEAVPIFLLDVALNGCFWREIEIALATSQVSKTCEV